jgi:hypothetical protein
VSALVLAFALVASADNPYLAEAKTLAASLDFERCVERLKQAQGQWRSTPAELRDIELWGGLCHFNLGHRTEAAEHFRTALRIDEGTDLPPYSSPKAVELFLEVKRALQKPVEPMPDADLPADTPTRVDLAPRPKAGPAVDLRPGVDWPRRAAPLALAAVALVAAGTAVGLGVNAQQLARQANAAHFESDFVALGRSAQGSATGATISWVVAGAALTGAVITWLTLPPSVSEPAAPSPAPAPPRP